MQYRFPLYVCLAFFLGGIAWSRAVPLTDPEIPTVSASKSPQSVSQDSEPHDVLPQPSADFVCPHPSKIGAIECFLDAVEHLYTVCRQVKSIEQIEFGFDKAEEGTNNLKSEFCRRKQKASLPSYFEAALREAQVMSSCEAAFVLNDLYVVWSVAIAGFRQYSNETEAEYRLRIAAPYSAFAAYSQQVRDALAADPGQQRPVQDCPNLTVFKP
ncbi:MAG: hypothetical protein FWC42_08085 [Proteobacteria bacterium]|nr:hypothetical protein [Pseudomonadota bacterium]